MTVLDVEITADRVRFQPEHKTHMNAEYLIVLLNYALGTRRIRLDLSLDVQDMALGRAGVRLVLRRDIAQLHTVKARHLLAGLNVERVSRLVLRADDLRLDLDIVGHIHEGEVELDLLFVVSRQTEVILRKDDLGLNDLEDDVFREHTALAIKAEAHHAIVLRAVRVGRNERLAVTVRDAAVLNDQLSVAREGPYALRQVGTRPHTAAGRVLYDMGEHGHGRLSELDRIFKVLVDAHSEARGRRVVIT